VRRAVLCGATIVIFLASVDVDASMRAWVHTLRSSDPAERVIAQAYIAHSGTPSLAELDKFARTKDVVLRRRVKEVVSLMLRKTVGPNEIRKYKTLWHLVEPELRKASVALQSIANQKDYDSGDVGLILEGTTVKISPPRSAVEQLVEMRGFAVPLALELLMDKQPGSRMYGVEILGRLDAVGQLSALQSMLKDDGHITVSHGCYWDETTVGAETPRWLAAGHLRRATYPEDKDTVKYKQYSHTFEAESYLFWLSDSVGVGSYDLINRLRRDAGTMHATSWEDYWSRARPVLTTILAPNN
jgi:hypothetical protein